MVTKGQSWAELLVLLESAEQCQQLHEDMTSSQQGTSEGSSTSGRPPREQEGATWSLELSPLIEDPSRGFGHFSISCRQRSK